MTTVLATIGYSIWILLALFTLWDRLRYRHYRYDRCSMTRCESRPVVIWLMHLTRENAVRLYACKEHEAYLREFEGQSVTWERTR